MIFKSRSQFTTGSFGDTENRLANVLCHRTYSFWNYTELANSRNLWVDCLYTSEWLDPQTGALSLIPVRNISICCKRTFREQWMTTVITQIKKITSYVSSTNIWTNKYNVKRLYFAYWRRINVNFYIIYFKDYMCHSGASKSDLSTCKNHITLVYN